METFLLVPKRTDGSRYWKQQNITPEMRWKLLDWLLDVASPAEMNLQNICLPLCFSLIDQYIISQYPIMPRERLQLLGITALFLAYKLYDLAYHSVVEFIEYTDYTWSKRDLLTMEQEILTKIGFDFLVANPWKDFTLDTASIKVVGQCLFEMVLLELTTMHYSLLDMYTLTMKVANGGGVDEVIQQAIQAERARKSSGQITALAKKYGDTLNSILCLPLPPISEPQTQVITRSKSKRLAPPQSAPAQAQSPEPPPSKRQRLYKSNNATNKLSQQCRGSTRNGTQCKRWATGTSLYCDKHQE